jgi:hypothetical protein
MKKIILLAILFTIGFKTQAQISICDSVGYNITTSPNSNILQLDGVNLNIGWSIDWDWEVCNNGLCFWNNGQTVYFQQFTTSDTLSICLIAYIFSIPSNQQCIICDSLVYGVNGWVSMNMSNPLHIDEILIEKSNNNRTYDLLGKKVFNIKPGEIYIRNNKKCILIK